jgi:hypothetical protein
MTIDTCGNYDNTEPGLSFTDGNTDDNRTSFAVEFNFTVTVADKQQ